LFPENKATSETFSKINLNHEKEIVFEKTVRLSDLDIVNHANNVKYLEWCLDLANETKILNQEIESFEMNFMKELSLQDEVVIHENSESNTSIFSITKDEKSCFALQLNWK
jgi:acyl-ACP thioesterase